MCDTAIRTRGSAIELELAEEAEVWSQAVSSATASRLVAQPVFVRGLVS